MNNEVLALILGGGRGTRLFPLTHHRSKPAVPIGGKYRLIDVPVSNCLHADMRRIFVLTQFNSASLNRHIAQTYRMDYRELVDGHIDRKADITIAAQPVTPHEASAMGIFRFDRTGRIVAFDEKPNADRLADIGRSIPAGSTFGAHSPEKPFVASMGIYVFSRDVLLDILRHDTAKDFGREVIPAALDTYRVNSHLFRGYWADVGTVDSFYHANIQLTRRGGPFTFYDPRRPIYTHPRFLPGSRVSDCTLREVIIAEGCFVDHCTVEESVIGIRTTIQPGAEIRRSVLLGADFYEADDDATARGDGPRLGIGRDVVLDRVIVDKNARIGDSARLVNEAGAQDADGDGYYIRSGVIVVPKNAVIKPGTTL